MSLFDIESKKSINTFNRGIKNVDSICYASTSLHLLMLIPNLMKHVETIVNEEDNDQDNGYNNDNKYIAVVWQLKQFLDQYHHQLSNNEKTNSADIVILCETLAEIEGQHFDEEISRDAVKFSHELLNAINKASFKDMINNRSMLTEIVGGEFVNVFNTECGKQRQNLESFYFLRFAPSNTIKDLHQALKEFTKDSLMKSQWKVIKQDDDGNDVIHKENLDTKYCTRIKRLSNHFFVHLKRFTIDYKTMSTEKVKSFFSFPLELDMSPYIDIEINDDTHKIYDFMGVIIHEGDSDDGHYYVIIKDNQNEDSDRQWLLIDDKHVEYFNIDNLPNVAFGGNDNDNDNDNENDDQSAYLLLYERRI